MQNEFQIAYLKANALSSEMIWFACWLVYGGCGLYYINSAVWIALEYIGTQCTSGTRCSGLAFYGNRV